MELFNHTFTLIERPKREFRGELGEVKIEDDGQSLIVEVADAEGRLFVRLGSWDTETQHEELRSAVGKAVTVRITVEEPADALVNVPAAPRTGTE